MIKKGILIKDGQWISVVGRAQVQKLRVTTVYTLTLTQFLLGASVFFFIIFNPHLKIVSVWQVGRGLEIRARQSELAGQCLASATESIINVMPADSIFFPQDHTSQWGKAIILLSPDPLFSSFFFTIFFLLSYQVSIGSNSFFLKKGAACSIKPLDQLHSEN